MLTGGQTGVDTAAARAALAAGLPVHLVFPCGFRQEDGPLTPARRRGLRGAVLHELAAGEFADRTRTCVDLSDAVILIDPAGGEGCRETQQAARDLGRPLLILAGERDPLLTLAGERDPLPGEPGEADDRRESGSGAADPDEVASWIGRTQARVLLVAGCRGSLLAAAGYERLAADLAAVVAAAARRRHEQLTS